MKYQDLIQFEPIESVIQLRHADKIDLARHLVSTYVISPQMAERLIQVMITQLQFEQPADNKGLFIVGNYGTGKSHLMAVISAIAENESLLEQVTQPKVAEAARQIAGKFKVIRGEIGGTMMSLRNIIISMLEMNLATWGIAYRFPAADQLYHHKAAFEEMMTQFQAQYPDQGLLLVLDELLDYLASRKELEVRQDLSFLREVGEVCQDTPFRFMAGVQESLFDNQRFTFVAESLRRVKDRFTQLLIVRQDVKFVVAERLLKKKADQLTLIRAHLSPFSKFYGGMNEQLDTFITLFPIHPYYIDIFDQLAIVERREVIKSLSQAMQQILAQDVPTDEPGVIAYDRYWQILCHNPAFRAEPDIKTVIECSKVLEHRVEQSLNPKNYRPLAKRIIHALSVHRLSSRDIRAKLGPTAEELRDTLCLFYPGIEEMGGEPAQDLLTQVQSVLKKIIQTVNGQFISQAADSGQYYLDVDKDVDYEARVAERAAMLSQDKFDSAYFKALTQILERSDSYYTGTHLAWEYELVWPSHQAGRRGYLFFGTPNERSTAQPPREFYIYFVQPLEPPVYKDEKREDEVLFYLKGMDDSLLQQLQLYAAADDLASTASGQAKNSYAAAANSALRLINEWLQKNLITAFQVSHAGQKKTVPEWFKLAAGRRGTGQHENVRDIVNLVCGVAFETHFINIAPEYPIFNRLMTQANRNQATQDALRSLQGNRTQQGTTVLDALELLDGEQIAPERSRYAQWILQQLRQKTAGQVVNRSEVLTVDQMEEYLEPRRFRLEPEFTVIVLAALVQYGALVLAIAGKKFDATSMSQLITTPLPQLREFKHLEPPKDWNSPALRALFGLLNMSPHQADAVTHNNEEAVRDLQEKCQQQIKALVLAQQTVQQGLVVWGQQLLTEAEQSRCLQQMANSKRFLESLQAYNSSAKFKNFQSTVDEIKSHQSGLDYLAEVTELKNLKTELEPLLGYLNQAEMALPDKDAWLVELKAKRQELLPQLKGAAHDYVLKQQVIQTLNGLKQRYLTTYMALHTQARLGRSDDRRKANLTNDGRVSRLQSLTTIHMLPVNQLTTFQTRLSQLKTCYNLDPTQLAHKPTCPDCGFLPSQEAVSEAVSSQLDHLSIELDNILSQWTETLLNNLEDPILQAETLPLLSAEQRAQIEQFLQQRRLPERLDNSFIKTVQEALSGLHKVTLSLADLQAALTTPNTAMTVAQFKQRVEQYLNHHVQGKDVNKIRIVIE